MKVGPDEEEGGIVLERALHNAVVRSKATRTTPGTHHPFRYRSLREEEGETELVDYYNTGEDRRVHGFERVPSSSDLCVLRHRRRVSILDGEGDILHGWATESDALSACALPMSDALCALEADGSVAVNSLETGQPVNVWTEAADVGR